MSQSGLEGGKYFHRDGSPAETFTEIRDEIDNGELAEDNIDGINVRTYFSGYNVGTFIEPKIFITSVTSGMHSGEYDYATEAEAAAGHARLVELVKTPIPENVVKLAQAIRELGTTNEYKIADFVLNNTECCR